MEELINTLKFDASGLIPAVVQNIETNEVLMVAYMNADTIKQTLETGRATFWSRSRQEVWVKGDTSGNYMYVKEVRVDCDCDCLVVLLILPALRVIQETEVVSSERLRTASLLRTQRNRLRQMYLHVNRLLLWTEKNTLKRAVIQITCSIRAKIRF